MKKLKKVLSLVLVLAMALSLFGANVFAAGTTDYTDDAELTYGSQAVAVMSELGVINGFEDGSFKPSEGYTREQAAKVITYMLATPEVAEKLDAPAKDVFADVKADRWSAADVAYAVDKKIIAGYGDGNFGPEDTLTRDQWLKMLLVALGKDPVKEGLLGDNWDTRAAALAMRTFITPAEYELEWNRETAVYYAFRALTGFEIKGQTLAEKLYKMEQTVNYDDFGAPVSFTLTNGKPATSAYYKEYATVEIFADYDWSNKVTELAKVENYDETTWTVLVDGKKIETPKTVGCNSADVKVYKMADHTYRVIVKENYFDVATKSEYTIGYFHKKDEGVKYPGEKLAPVPQTVTKKDTKTGALELDGEAITFACKASGKDVKGLNVSEKYDVYYDSYGNVVYVAAFQPYAPEPEVVFVYDSIVTAEPVYDGIGFDKIVDKDFTAQAKIMRMDGTLDTVNLATARVGKDLCIVNKYGYAGNGNKLPDGSLVDPNLFAGTKTIGYDTVSIITGLRGIYDVKDIDERSPYGNFYNMYTFEDGTVTLESTREGNSYAGDLDNLGTTKGSRVLTVDSIARGYYANGSTNLTVITIDPVPTATSGMIVADGEVSQVKGVANFDTTTYVDAFVKLNAVGTVATDIYAIALKNNVTYTYGYYLGTTVETIEDGLTYEFGLSDGTTVEFTADYSNPANFTKLEKGTVYRVQLTKGVMTGTKPLYEHKQGYGVEDDGYFVLLRDNTQRDVDVAFGGYAWGADGAKKPATYENSDKADYLVLYYDTEFVNNIVFATYIDDPDYVKTIDATWTGAAFVTADGKDIFAAAGTSNWTDEYYVLSGDKEIAISAADVAKYYAGKTFTFTLEGKFDIDGVETRTLTKAVTAADDFYFYTDSDNKLYYVDVDTAPLAAMTQLSDSTHSYTTAKSGWDFCTSAAGCTFIQVDALGQGTVVEGEPAGNPDLQVNFKAYLNCVDAEHLAKIVVFDTTRVIH